MKEFTLEIAGLKRTLSFVPIDEKLAYASFVVISDTELVKTVAPLLAEKINNCDMIVTAEAKGIALAYEVSKLLNQERFVVARKSVKGYMKDPVSISVKSITTENVQRLYLDQSDIVLIKGRKVCLLDDVVSTGESLSALQALVDSAGGIVSGKACILAEGEAAKRDDLIYLEGLPLFVKTRDGEYEVLK